MCTLSQHYYTEKYALKTANGEIDTADGEIGRGLILTG
jgi:hypothetical protein